MGFYAGNPWYQPFNGNIKNLVIRQSRNGNANANGNRSRFLLMKILGSRFLVRDSLYHFKAL